MLLYSDHKRVQLCGTKTTFVSFVVCLCESSSNLQTVCTLLLHDLLLKESNHVTVYLWNANLRGVERVYTNQSSLVKAVIRYSTLCFIRSLMKTPDHICTRHIFVKVGASDFMAILSKLK